MGGKLREVEYGAAPDRGFEPQIEGVIVAPPTINAEPEFNAEPILAEPQPALPQQRAEQPRFANFQPSALPAAPQQQARRIRPRPQQQRFQPQQRFTPAVPQQTSGPLPSSVSFFNHPYISDFDSGAGVFSYSYGK